jgi:hypothetical protein
MARTRTLRYGDFYTNKELMAEARRQCKLHKVGRARQWAIGIGKEVYFNVSCARGKLDFVLPKRRDLHDPINRPFTPRLVSKIRSGS